jgi:predicted MFS family arabinose efflux permease
VVWTVGVAGHFSKHQGKAVGVTLCGPGIATAVSVPLAYWVYQHFGWRAAFPAVYFGGFLVAYPIVWLFFHDAKSGSKQPSPARRGHSVDAAAPDLTFAEALRTTRFWRLIVSMVLTGACVTAFSLHFVSMMTDDKVSPTEAVGLAALLGPFSIAGRLISAFLLDIFEAPLVGAVAFALPIVSATILFQHMVAYEALVLAAFLIGVSQSADAQVPAYLIPKYFGYRSYGRIFGLAYGLLFVGMGFGPVLAGAIFDMTGSYRTVFILVIAALSVGALLIGTLGRYKPVPSR